jgi:SpoVK/Ycf46/Vps4 family AAA+-type ATPase
MGFEQWARSPDGTTYSPVGQTVSEIEPGYYDTVLSQGQVYFCPVRPRQDALLEFPDSASKGVLDAITDFWERENIFQKYDLPYKRGILLYGPPGSGKTCTLQLVSREVVNRGGIVVTFQPASFLDAYRAFRDVQPSTYMVVLMEDLEATLKQSESRILNLLDGVEYLNKVVFLATTNYPEKLESRILNRPSRFDLCVKVGHPDARARRVYLRSLIRDDDGLDVETYVNDTEGMSLAHVKELFVATVVLGSEYETTVKRLKAMREKKSSIDDEITGTYGQMI